MASKRKTKKDDMEITADTVLDTRINRGENQTEFWGRLGVTQSGGCRYETGRNIPTAVRRLFVLVYVAGMLDTLKPSITTLYHAQNRR